MKLYNSYIKTRKEGDVEDLIFVKNGFAFLAFFFNFLWFGYNKMFKWVAIVILFDWLLIKAIGFYNPSAFDTLVIFFSTSLLIGANANYLHSKYLRAKGYEFVGCVFGENREAAKLRFVEGYLDKYDEETIKRYKFLNKQDRPSFFKDPKENK